MAENQHTNRCNLPRMQKYTSQAIEIEAMQYRPGFFRDSTYPEGVKFEPGPTQGEMICYIDTLEGRMTVSPGDWIIRGTEGELYPCKPSVFDRKYRPSEENEMAEQPISRTDEFTPPTVGRIVLYGTVKDGQLTGTKADPIGAAGVVEVVEETEGSVFLEIWGQDDAHRFRHCDHASKVPDGDRGWDWMPYQKGQAKKLEQVQAIEFPGLREPMSDAQLDNRFVYHPPSEIQVGAYQDIREEAKNFAKVLQHHCPSSPELASALDHLDTVVFKANASIARHS